MLSKVSGIGSVQLCNGHQSDHKEKTVKRVAPMRVVVLSQGMHTMLALLTRGWGPPLPPQAVLPRNSAFSHARYVWGKRSFRRPVAHLPLSLSFCPLL